MAPHHEVLTDLLLGMPAAASCAVRGNAGWAVGSCGV